MLPGPTAWNDRGPGGRARQPADHEFLLAGDVFSPDVIESWIAFKREHEIDPMRLRPHPYEVALYFDV